MINKNKLSHYVHNNSVTNHQRFFKQEPTLAVDETPYETWVETIHKHLTVYSAKAALRKFFYFKGQFTKKVNFEKRM